MQISDFVMSVTTRLNFDAVILKTTEFLKEVGFGVLTEVDVREILKKKLTVDFKPYRILGACNPNFALRALTINPHLGVFLPCSVVVWDEGDHRVVSAFNPSLMETIASIPEEVEIAKEVRALLEKALLRIENLDLAL